MKEPTAGDDGANESRRASRVHARPPHHDDYCLLPLLLLLPPLLLLLLLLLLLDTTNTTTTTATAAAAATTTTTTTAYYVYSVLFDRLTTIAPPWSRIPEGTVRGGSVEGKKKTFSATRLRTGGLLQRVHTHAHNNIYRVIV